MNEPVQNLHELIAALSHITEVVQSGWTGDIYLSTEDAAAFNGGLAVTFPHENLHIALSRLTEGWQRTETADGGVITYTKGGE